MAFIIRDIVIRFPLDFSVAPILFGSIQNLHVVHKTDTRRKEWRYRHVTAVQNQLFVRNMFRQIDETVKNDSLPKSKRIEHEYNKEMKPCRQFTERMTLSGDVNSGQTG